MPKRAARSADPTPKMGNPPAPDFLKKLAPEYPIQPQAGMKKVAGSSVSAMLRTIGKGWNGDIERMLSIPQELFSLESGDATFYSADGRFGISEAISAIQRGEQMSPPTDYGIAVYSSGGAVFFVLVDVSRRIIVRERLMNIHDSPPEKDWSGVSKAITAAIELSSGSKNQIAVSDCVTGTLKLVNPA